MYDNEEDGVAYSYSFFHFMFMIAVFYLMLVLTDWWNADTDPTLNEVPYVKYLIWCITRVTYLHFIIEIFSKRYFWTI